MNKYKTAFFGLLALVALLIVASVVYAQTAPTTPAPGDTSGGTHGQMMGPGAMGDGADGTTHGPGMMGDGTGNGSGAMGDGTGHGPGMMNGENWQKMHESMGQNMPEGMQQMHDTMGQAMQSGDWQKMHDACQTYHNQNGQTSS